MVSRPKLKIVEPAQEQWLQLIDEATIMSDVDVSVEFPRGSKGWEIFRMHDRF